MGRDRLRLTIVRHCLVSIAVCFCLLAFDEALAQPTTQPDPAAMYQTANSLVKTDCPSSSNLDYSGPPFPLEWVRMEANAIVVNRPALDLVHQASLAGQADWPTGNDVVYLNQLRNLAKQVGDASLYLEMRGDDAAATEKVEDMLRMAEQLDHGPKPKLFELLVAGGIRALDTDRLNIISSEVRLTTDPANQKDLQVSDARRLIAKLLDDQGNPSTEIGPLPEAAKMPKATRGRFIESLNRCNAECTLAAMSLACHLFQQDNQRWPYAMDELVPKYLPREIIDPWGDGKETFGYVLIGGGLPDGMDRPLVYSRCNSRDGLFFRLDEPEYGFYFGDGSAGPRQQQKQGGEFFDVVRWTPKPRAPTDQAEPTTQALEWNGI